VRTTISNYRRVRAEEAVGISSLNRLASILSQMGNV